MSIMRHQVRSFIVYISEINSEVYIITFVCLLRDPKVKYVNTAYFNLIKGTKRFLRTFFENFSAICFATKTGTEKLSLPVNGSHLSRFIPVSEIPVAFTNSNHSNLQGCIK